MDWQVEIDKKTFNAYRQSTNPELKALFAQNVKRKRSLGSDDSYARIELKDTQECPLMEERLCAVQKRLNESHLSHICFSYPRTTRNFGGQYEQMLTLSCPEAARQALLHADAFDFMEGKITVRMNTVTEMRSTPTMPLEVANEIRIFCLSLMRTQGAELWQKLAILGVFCESLTSLLDTTGAEGVPQLLDSFTAMVEQGAAFEALAGMKPNHSAQALVFAILWKQKMTVTGSPVQNQMFDAVLRGLGAQVKGGVVMPDELIRCYTHGVSRLDEALQAAPHLLEHYILNELFTNLFPFCASTPYEDYLQLISRFGLIRLMMAALCNTQGELPDADMLVRTVQVFCRRFQHDPNFANEVNQALKESGWSSLDKVYGFLRA